MADTRRAKRILAAPVMIEVRDLEKTFRTPEHRVDTLKERVVHPLRRVAFRELRALGGVSFEVHRGEFFGVVGRNGSGKSTLLKVLASIYRADSGSVRIAGRLAPFIELGVGFNAELTARENVELNGVMMGLGRRQARARLDAVLEFAELQEFTELKLKNYSSGMMVRLAFAVMVEADADVMLVDEVLAVGDAAFAQKCMDVFREKRAAGKTLVLVTHDMATVQAFCDRATLLHDGEQQFLGDPEEAALRYYRLNFGGETTSDGEARSRAIPDINVSLLDVWLEDQTGTRVENVEQGTTFKLNLVAQARQDLLDPGLQLPLPEHRRPLGVRVQQAARRRTRGAAAGPAWRADPPGERDREPVGTRPLRGRVLDLARTRGGRAGGPRPPAARLPGLRGQRRARQRRLGQRSARGDRAAGRGLSLAAYLERPLPASLPVGRGTAVFCTGHCSHPGQRLRGLEVLRDGTPHRAAAFGMPRPDLPPGHSGFWGTVPVPAADRAGAVRFELRARFSGDSVTTVPLGEIPIVAPAGMGAMPTDPGLIAVCMATFEPNPTLFDRQIQSLRAQTHEQWVCVISDDCSQPQSFERILETVGDDNRFTVSRSEQRLGFYRNFERALEMAPTQAQLVALCDQDDLWRPEKLTVLRDALGGAALAYCDQRLVSADGVVLRDTLWRGRRNNYDNLASMVVANTITGAAMLLRREVVELALPFPDTPGFQFHDHWLASVGLAAGQVAYVERPLYDYVQHAGAVFGESDRRGRGRSRCAARHGACASLLLWLPRPRGAGPGAAGPLRGPAHGAQATGAAMPDRVRPFAARPGVAGAAAVARAYWPQRDAGDRARARPGAAMATVRIAAGAADPEPPGSAGRRLHAAAAQLRAEAAATLACGDVTGAS